MFLDLGQGERLGLGESSVARAGPPDGRFHVLIFRLQIADFGAECGGLRVILGNIAAEQREEPGALGVQAIREIALASESFGSTPSRMSVPDAASMSSRLRARERSLAWSAASVSPMRISRST